MKNASRTIALLTGCLLLIGVTGASAQDWSQWRGANQDGKVTGFKAPQEWPGKFTKKWQVTVGLGNSTPALVGDKLYVFTRQGADEVMLCLDASSGEELWRDQYAAQVVTGAAARGHPGPRSSPVVAEGKIVAMGVGGVLSCWDLASHELAWRNDPFPKSVPTFFTSSSPIVVDGLAIAHLGKAGGGAIIAYELATGDEKWRWDAEGPEYGSPVLSTAQGVKQIVTLTEKSIVAVGAADGKLLWSLPFPIPRRAYNATTPNVDGDIIIYTGAARGATAVRIEKKDEGLVAAELWSNPDLSPQYTTPVVKDGLLFGFTSRGQLYCLDAKTGQTAWTDETARDRSGFGSIIDAGSCLVVLPSNGELIIYKPSKEKYEELAKIKVAETSTYAHPVLAGNRIYVKDQESVIMWIIE